MNLRRICHEHCPRPELGRGVGENIAETAALMFLVIAAAAAAITVLHVILHWLWLIATCAGFLVFGVIAGYLWVVLPARRRAVARVRADVLAAGRRHRPLPSQPQAIPAGEQHSHNHLHLPDNPDAAVAAVRAMRGDQ